ncbi:MAG: hypothetical protein V3W18_14415 [candidate division Zixibacteria bacterium]
MMISNYFHDLSVAILASNILAVYYIGRFLDKNPTHETIIPELFERLSKITYAAFAYIIVAGAVRAYFFIDFEWNPAVGKGQVTALIIKHIILFTITVFGIIVHLRYYRKYGKKG